MKNIKNAISKFSNNGSLIEGTKELFKALNIPFQVISSADYKPSDFFEKTDKFNDKIIQINTVILIDDKAFNNQYATIASNTLRNTDKYDALGVFTVDLSEPEPSRSTLVEITRALNREMEAFPVAVVFRYGNTIAIASTERTDYKSSSKSGEKIGKVSLIRDIDTINIHPGHLQILNELSIERTGKNAITSFDGLYKYWFSVFNVSLLNKKFYKELSNWYFWALREVKFPNEPNRFDFESDDKYDEAINEHNGKNIIRLLTRILFVWFIKEKGLIPEEIFDEKIIAERFIDGFTPEKPESLFSTGKHSSKYYRGIIQNLFFATLNQPHSKREFRNSENRQHHNVTQLMRYKEYLKEPEYFKQLMEDKVPFMNGGLFECLDKPHPTQKGKQGGEIIIYIDGFSDRDDNVVTVPDFLFFDKEEELDLSKDYGDKTRKKEKTRGLITILKNYKFTITENTPIEEEVALDPELLGKVFENLLASYNPETKSSARKQTGSFYTPREIVNYMVEESLIAYLKNKLNYNEPGVLPLGSDQIQLLGNDYKIGQLQIEENINQSNYFGKEDLLEEDLRELVSFSSSNPFENDTKTKHDIIKALDQCTILDPACGSGAYPMGILQKMVHILHKIDPNNEEWKQRQLEKVNKALDDIYEIEDNSIRDKISKELKEQIKDIEESFNNNELDFGRKLYLIENCIYGVDIQPIATQISKLRFFISLVVDQKVDATKDNFGIRPLPNLETKFVAANTLVGLDKSSNLFDLPEIKVIEKQLKKVRQELFSAKNKKTKNEKRELDKVLRNQIASNLEENGFGTDIAKKLAAWDPYDQNTSSDFFDKEWMFDRTEGFDIVIGNPPYIKENTNKSVFEVLKTSEYYQGKMDIWYLFTCNGLDILKENGILCYIAPNNWTTNSGASKMRNKILKDGKINKILDFSSYMIFESADIQTMVFLINKTTNNNDYEFELRKIKSKNSTFENIVELITKTKSTSNEFLEPKISKALLIDKTFTFPSDLDEKVLNKIKRKENIKLNKNTEIAQGIVLPQDSLNKKNKAILGNNFNLGDGIFVLKNSELITLNIIEKEKELIKPYYTTEQIQRWYANPKNDEWIIYTNSSFKKEHNINPYPNIKNHLDKFQPIITSSNKPYGLHRSRVEKFFLGEKIITLRKCVGEPKFTYTDFDCYVSATFYIIKTNRLNQKYLTGLLNSRLIAFWLKNKGKMQGNNYQLDKDPLMEIPIYNPSEKIQSKFSTKIDSILHSKKENISSESVEREIDVMVYHLYELSYEEALIIDSELSLEDWEKYRI